MKRNIRYTVLFALLTTLCLLFCSCRELDELRDRHAFYTDDTHQAISYRGNVYRLYENADLSLSYYNLNYDRSIRVTESDVPVLLSGNYGGYYAIDVSNTLIVGHEFTPYTEELEATTMAAEDFEWKHEEDSIDYFQKDLYYIREDRYDDLIETLATLKLDHLCYQPFSDMVLMDDETAASLKRDCYLSSTVYGPDYMERLYDAGYYYNSSMSVYRTTKDLILIDYFGEIYEMVGPNNQTVTFFEFSPHASGNDDMLNVPISHPELFQKILHVEYPVTD